MDVANLQAGLSRYSNGAPQPPKEQLAVVTIRMSKEEHEALKKASHKAETSMNSYCMSAVLTAVLRTLGTEENS